MKEVAGLVARALRGAANRLDPEPPYMKECLRMLGWVYDGQRWEYVQSWTAPGASGANTASPYGVIEWYPGKGEDE